MHPDVKKALEEAASAVLDRFFGGSSGLDEIAEAIARDHARAAILAFVKAMPFWPDGLNWTVAGIRAELEEEP